jgi:hypothetical protein
MIAADFVPVSCIVICAIFLWCLRTWIIVRSFEDIQCQFTDYIWARAWPGLCGLGLAVFWTSGRALGIATAANLA